MASTTRANLREPAMAAPIKRQRWQIWLIFAISAALVFGLAYWMGHPFLEDHLKGNDMPFAITLLAFLERWFPPIPSWFPDQGAGQAFLKSYSFLPFIGTFALGQFLPLTLVQLARLVGFLAIPLSALGLLWFVWVRFQRPGMALVAALFYLVSPMSWGWLTAIGLFAPTVSLVLIMPVLTCHYLACERRGKPWVALYALALTLLAISHVVTLLITLALITGHLAVMIWTGEVPFWRGLRTTLIGGIWASLLSAFFLLPFYQLNQIATTRGLALYDPYNLPYLDLLQLLGFPRSIEGLLAESGIAFAPSATILAAIGVALAALASRRNRALLGLAALAGAVMLFSAAPGLVPSLTARIALFYSLTLARESFIPMFLVPILAAYGATRIAGLLAAIVHLLLPGGLARGLAGLLTMTAVVGLVISLPYGPVGSDHRPSWKNLPKFAIDDAPPLRAIDVAAIAERLQLGPLTRLDVSPSLGGVVESLNIFTDASQINAYQFQGSLIHAMWGYQQQVFYGQTAKPEVRDDLAKWFGVEYLLLSPNDPAMRVYQPPQWEPVLSDPEVTAFRFREATGLVTVADKPAVLIIGNIERAAYETVFRTASLMGFGYDQALLIEGAEQIDAYSLEELQQFDAIWLYGYSYRNQKRAWQLLEAYVKDGGSLFIETGWQFVSADWESRDLAAPSPVKRTYWAEIGTAWRPEVRQHPITQGIRGEDFSPPLWGNQPWGLSTADLGDVASWASPLLLAEGHPILVAGQYGQGKVVWSGMNLLAHAITFQNEAEYRLHGQIMRWLAPQRSSLGQITLNRPFPDRLEIDIAQAPVVSGVLFREPLIANWHAFAQVDGQRVSLPLYKAGPGFMYAKLPQDLTFPTQVTFEYRNSFLDNLAIAISLLAALAFILWLVGFPTRGAYRRWLRMSLSAGQR